KGSDTEVNISVILAEAYFAQHPESRISISGGGSGLGIASLMNGLADMANSSRPLSPYEEALCRERGVELIPVVFAQDALAVIAHADVPIDSLSVSQIRAIFSGAAQRWDELGIDYPRPISIYGRQSNSGTYVYFRDRLQIVFSPRAREMNGNAQIIEAIKADKQSIGYVGAGYVIKDGRQSSGGFRILKVYEDGKAACSPLDYQKVLDGYYFFQRPLYQYVLKSSYARVKALLDFEKSAEGQKIIVAHGYFPAK
ncbi:MAG: PstS family phosphate ABC transporter substrate-binding protein, partial [Saprospiraceae bacterium]